MTRYTPIGFSSTCNLTLGTYSLKHKAHSILACLLMPSWTGSIRPFTRRDDPLINLTCFHSCETAPLSKSSLMHRSNWDQGETEGRTTKEPILWYHLNGRDEKWDVVGCLLPKGNVLSQTTDYSFICRPRMIPCGRRCSQRYNLYRRCSTQIIHLCKPYMT